MSTSSMRAAAFSEFGGPEVLRVMELAVPQAGPGQVRVRVRAAGVQPYDAAVRAGWTPPGVTGGLPRIPGNEFAGVIDQVGDGVGGVAGVIPAGSGGIPGGSGGIPGGVVVGAEVLGFTQLGAYAEFVVVPASDVTAKPDGVPWEVAGALTSGVQTAEIALDGLGVGEGDTLLVHGASGSVGTAAVQIGRMRGATVIGTGRPENHEYLRDLGAIPVAYGEGLADRVRALAPGGVDAALDGAGGDALNVSLELVKDRGRILTLVDHDKAAGLGVKVTQGVRTAERLGRYAALYAEGRLKFAIRRAFPLEEAAEAHREIETGHGRGKLVITIPA